MMEEDSSHEGSPAPAEASPDSKTEIITQKLADTSIVDQLKDAASEPEAAIKTETSAVIAKPSPVAPTTPAAPTPLTATGTSAPLSSSQLISPPAPLPAQVPQYNPYSAHRHQTPQTAHTSYPPSATAATGSPLFYNPASVSTPMVQPQIYTPPAMPQQSSTMQGISMPPTQGYTGGQQVGYPSSQQMQHYTPAQTQAAAHAPYGSSSAVDLPLDAGSMPYQQQQQNYNVEMGGGSWFSGGIMNTLKSSVETMITVLDPGMKQYIYSGGDIDVIVASDKETKIGPVREAFQAVFGKATVTGMGSQANIAAQPVGFTAGVKGAEERIENLRRSGFVDERQTILAIENFLAEVIPDKWFDIGCLVLKDPLRNINLQVFTQAIPIPPEYMQQIQDDTPQDYPLRWSGYSVTIGEMICRYQPHVHRSEWHASLTGVTRQEMILPAAKALAGLYKQQLQPMSS